jgi:hypothetical protein
MEKEEETKKTLEGEESRKLDRKEFLKTVGVGIGALALGSVVGGEALASRGRDSEMAPLVGGRSGIQRLVRYLVEHPEKANEFLMHPIGVAQELGIVVDAREMDLIRNAITEMQQGEEKQFLIARVKKPIKKPTRHADFAECHHVEVKRPPAQ